MKVVGLTGSIGMGKSTAASMFAELGAHVLDADKIVHRLYRTAEVTKKISKEFPGTVAKGEIDRKALAKEVLNNDAAMKRLENIIHPLVVQEELHFLERCKRKGVGIAVLEIPLLFETGAESRCDFTAVVMAPAFIQRQRVMRRKDMTEEKFQALRSRQMPDDEKTRRADAIIPTGLGKRFTMEKIKQIVHFLREEEKKATRR